MGLIGSEWASVGSLEGETSVILGSGLSAVYSFQESLIYTPRITLNLYLAARWSIGHLSRLRRFCTFCIASVILCPGFEEMSSGIGETLFETEAREEYFTKPAWHIRNSNYVDRKWRVALISTAGLFGYFSLCNRKTDCCCHCQVLTYHRYSF